ncbi:hypothetical protein K501DRAFT_276607 [Backusella circina FSU 941]|nr:hypothetical protein K501DRAFT_276607 [Backusella circina FSU 941]
MISTIATQTKPRPTNKRSSSCSSSRVMTPIPEHQQQQQQQRYSSRQKPKVKASKRDDDIPLALLAYKRGYTTIHPTIPEKQSTTGTNRSRESSTSRSILKQQQNTTDKQHKKSKSDMTPSGMNRKKGKKNKYSSLSSTCSSPRPPPLAKPQEDRPDKKSTPQPLTKHNVPSFAKLKQWFSLLHISNRIKKS